MLRTRLWTGKTRSKPVLDKRSLAARQPPTNGNQASYPMRPSPQGAPQTTQREGRARGTAPETPAARNHSIQKSRPPAAHKPAGNSPTEVQAHLGIDDDLLRGRHLLDD